MRSVAGILSPEAYQNGVQAGIEKGMEKGMEKGRGEGIRMVLLNQLMIKFGPVSERNIAKLQSVKNADALNGLSMSLITAKSLDEFMVSVDKILDTPSN